jgi:hypothetical protein
MIIRAIGLILMQLRGKGGDIRQGTLDITATLTYYWKEIIWSGDTWSRD